MTQPNNPRWFAQFWPFKGKRDLLLGEYAALGQMKYFLTDLALRGSVFDAGPDVTTVYDAGVVEGRRRLALEIIKLAAIDPQTLFALVETEPRDKRMEDRT